MQATVRRATLHWLTMTGSFEVSGWPSPDREKRFYYKNFCR
jgi:hypothetical protein